MLGFVRQVRAAIFHFRDARIRIARVRPIVVGTLLLALPVEARQLARIQADVGLLALEKNVQVGLRQSGGPYFASQ